MATALHTRAGSTRARRGVVLIATALCMMTRAGAAAAADPVMEWNDIARQLVVVPALSPVEQTRVMAMVHVAVHDAVNGITHRYERYSSTDAVPAAASAEAAAIAAAYGVLRDPQLFGDTTFLKGKYAASLVAHGIAPDDPGLAFGDAVAQGILLLRRNDGASTAKFSYVAPGAGTPGVWVPVSPASSAQALLPGWGDVTPFVLRHGAQFRPDPPPALDSDRYARDYNEIVQIGASASLVRTNEQTQIALFWRASPTALWNPVLRRAIEFNQLDLSASARAAALFYLAASDASVACWNAKYFYNFWRPQAAIIAGDTDNNPATGADKTWAPLVPTPPHPEYPSAHSTNSAAMAYVLAQLFGDAPGFMIDVTSSQNVGFVRHWQTFSEGVEEVIDARVYSGIHFRNSDEIGARLGSKVAKFVIGHALKPVKNDRP